MSGASADSAPGGDAVTLDGLNQTVQQGFRAMGGKLDRLIRSSKAIEAGLADSDELRSSLARLRSGARQSQVQEVLSALNAHPRWSVAFASKSVHRATPGGFPTAAALTTACYRVNIMKFATKRE